MVIGFEQVSLLGKYFIAEQRIILMSWWQYPFCQRTDSFAKKPCQEIMLAMV